MKIKRIFAALTVAATIAALAACDRAAVENPAVTTVDVDLPPQTSARYTPDGRRIITIGTWQDLYFTSKHTDIYDDPTVPTLSDEDDEETRADKERRIHIAEMRLANIRAIEERYNIVLESVNLTFEGVRESIRVSVTEGVPDVDIYQVDSQFGIPAALEGHAMALEDIGLAGTDVFDRQLVTKHLKLTGQDKSYLFNQSLSGSISAYPLAFNLDMLLAAGLENPQDLYDRGEWTWEVWEEYLRVLTKDTDGDGEPNIYGYSGYWTDMLRNLLMSNGAGIAQSAVQTLDSAPTREVLDFIHTLYNTDKTARPWDGANWEINNTLYAEGLSAFWIGADWIFNQQGGAELPFEIGVVPWPCGPSGNAETNSYSSPDTNWFMIPVGAEDAELIYNVIFDWLNWYDYDLTIGDDRNWSRTNYMTPRNYDYAVMMSQKQGFDLWDSLSRTTGFSLYSLLQGEQDTQGVIEGYSAPFQAALDKYFGN